MKDDGARVMALGEGFHVLPAAVYHSDPAPEPSLSNSIMRKLLDGSPRHAFYAHPRLSPAPVIKAPTEEMEHGTALHHLLLGGGNPPVIVPADSWRTQAARDKRDAARAADRAPVLADDYAELCRCANAVLEQMREEPDCGDFFAPGRSEVTMLWREADLVWCRGMVDRLPDDPAAPLFNLKSTGMSASPAALEWKLRNEWAPSSALYLRGARALGRTSREERFIAFETAAPYCMSVNAADPPMLETAELEVKRAVMEWFRATATGEWRGYERGTHYVGPSLTQLIAAETANPQPLEQAA